MEFQFNAENLSKPWFRAIIGIIFIIAGFLCFTSDNVYSGVTRESCTEVEAGIYEVRPGKIENGRHKGFWVILDDYDVSLNIHPSCVTPELTTVMLDIKKGERVKLLYTDKNSNIYELWVKGEKVLDFDTANKKIQENSSLLKYASYVLLPAGALFLISSFIKKKNKADS